MFGDEAIIKELLCAAENGGRRRECQKGFELRNLEKFKSKTKKCEKANWVVGKGQE